MDSFESLVAVLLRQQGYWTATSFKVNLTKEEKRLIGKTSTPRWEIDVLAYKGATNEVLAVECKSFLDSRGVIFRDGSFEPPKRYQLFSNSRLRAVVLRRLALQVEEAGLCRATPRTTLCLAAGKIAQRSDYEAMRVCFSEQGWKLFDPEWIRQRLIQASECGYENDVSVVVSKILWRKSRGHGRRSEAEPADAT